MPPSGMDDHHRNAATDGAATEGLSWARADRLLMAVVIALALIYAAWQVRQQLFDGRRAATNLNAAAAGSAARASQQLSPSTAFDYARLIDDENFHVLLGLAYGNSGMLDQAIFHEREALRINGRSLAALNNLGYYLFLKGDFPGSASVLEQALSIDPRSDLARNNLQATYARAIETAATDEERKHWQSRRLALGAGNVAAPAALAPPAKPK
jgi:Flp pilus assembly protein TadD